LASLAAYPNLFDFYMGSQRLLQNLALIKPAEALREELCPEGPWYRSEVYNECRRPIQPMATRYQSSNTWIAGPPLQERRCCVS
jgi:hypothetical protein